jgi:hypothetical protein
MAIDEGYIIVTKLDGKVIQEVLMAGLDVSPNGEFIAQRFKRAGLETAPGSGTYTWSRWDATASQNTLARYGIEANIAGYNPIGSTHPDTIINAGKYWFSSATPDMPFQYGIMDVEVITLSSGVPGEVVQTIRWEGRLMNRNRYQVGPTTWYWSEWQVINGYDLQTENRMYDGGNLDSRLTPGVYYYHVNNINRPTDYGLLTVERETPDIVYQQAHGSDNTFHTRYRDGLGVWTPWAKLLSTNDNLVDHIGNGLGYFTPLGVSTYYMTLPGNATIRVYLVGGGGGGGGYTGAASRGQDGQDSYFIADGNEIARAYGGKGGFPGYGASANKYDIDPPPRTSWLFSRWSLDKTSILTMNGSKDGVHGFDRFHTALSDGFGVGGQPNPAFPDNWRRASVGGQSGHIEVLYKNPGALPISFTIVIGDGGAGGDSQATKGGEGRGLILIN